MKITLGEYILDIYTEKNKKYYKDEEYVSEGCQCDGCLNYELAVEEVEQEVNNLFNKLGIDIKKPAEVYVNYSENNIICYGGFYHICGKIVEGETAWKITSKTQKFITSYLNEDTMFCITKNFKISFDESCLLLQDSFPRPCIQMEISAYLPWKLDKENMYEQ